MTDNLFLPMRGYILCVAGPRDWIDARFVRATLDMFYKEHQNIVKVVHGGAKGVDTITNQWAHDNGIKVETFPANWDEFGRAAGPMRNKEMAKVADVLVAFRYPNSPLTSGTCNMLKCMTNKIAYVSCPYDQIICGKTIIQDHLI